MRLFLIYVSLRYFASDAAHKPSAKEDKGDADDGHKAEKSESSGGWLSRLLLRKIETGHVSHESVLSHRDTVYELQCEFCHMLLFHYTVRTCFNWSQLQF